jgi:hypothetical protein
MYSRGVLVTYACISSSYFNGLCRLAKLATGYFIRKGEDGSQVWICSAGFPQRRREILLSPLGRVKTPYAPT